MALALLSWVVMRLVRLVFALILTISFASNAGVHIVWGTADQPHHTVWGNLTEAR